MFLSIQKGVQAIFCFLTTAEKRIFIILPADLVSHH